jgi:hypothetical protein
MAEDRNISIKRVIVHILDSSVGVPVISQREHPADTDVEEFLAKHIQKILNDSDLKKGMFIGGSAVKEICEHMVFSPGDFPEDTGNIARSMYDLMLKYPDIPSADLTFVLFDADGVEHLGILKFNYKSSYIHYIGSGSDGTLNTIIKQKTALPGDGQKVDECAVINLRDLEVGILEKKYEINGDKQVYFSNMLLECSCNMSVKEKVRKFKKATESFNEKILQGDIENSGSLRAAISDTIDEKAEIDVVRVAETAFKRNPGLQDMYIDYVEKAGVEGKTIEVDENTSQRVFKRHKIKTDTGIEINLPVEYYKDRGKVEFVTNPDGTISIILKNITSITDC